MSEEVKNIAEDEEEDMSTESIANTIYALASALESLQSFRELTDMQMLPKQTKDSFPVMQKQILDSLKFYCSLLPH